MDYSIQNPLETSAYPSRKVAVAMSGGVDSSLTASLLTEAGFDCIGLTMQLWDYDRSGGRANDRGCCDLSSVTAAKRVAYELKMPHYTVNLKEDFEHCVVEDFINEYLAGRTPNPCVRCNTLMKWTVLMKKAEALGFDMIATGHYARIARGSDDAFYLVRGTDSNKDQSYFLWGLDSAMLERTLFPLGSLTKEETRLEAQEKTLATAEKSESQEICFIPDDDYGRFLRERHLDSLPLSLREGDILSVEGEKIGRHSGASFYTIGQRRGLGIALGYPVYVVATDTEKNTVTVGTDDMLFSDNMSVSDILWAGRKQPSTPFTANTKVRYRHQGSTAVITPEGNSATVRFETPQRAITSGQSAVFYDGEVVIGGGIINSRP